jgi:hypothetical protein
MKFLDETFKAIIERHPIDYQKSRRRFILELIFNDGNFNRLELNEINIALSLLTNEELGQVETRFHSGENTLKIAVEIIARVRLKY